MGLDDIDIKRIITALERIATAEERIANHLDKQHEGQVRLEKSLETLLTTPLDENNSASVPNISSEPIPEVVPVSWFIENTRTMEPHIKMSDGSVRPVVQSDYKVFKDLP